MQPSWRTWSCGAVQRWSDGYMPMMIELEESSWKLMWLLCRTKLMSAFRTRVPKNNVSGLACWLWLWVLWGRKIECQPTTRRLNRVYATSVAQNVFQDPTSNQNSSVDDIRWAAVLFQSQLLCLREIDGKLTRNEIRMRHRYDNSAVDALKSWSDAAGKRNKIYLAYNNA